MISRWRCFACIIVAICSTFCCSGLPFGFAGFYSVLLDHGVFSEYCGDQTLPCEAQRLQLSLLFTISVASLNIFATVSGTLLDIYGPKITATCASLCVAFGLALFGSGTPGTTGGYRTILGFFIFSVCGPLCFMSTISFANYFPRRSGTITSLCVGSFDASSLVFVLLAIAYTDFGASFTSLFEYYALVPVVLAVACCLFYPMTAVNLGKLEQPLCEKKRSTVPAENCYEHLSLWNQLASWPFMIPCWTVAVYMVRLNFFIQTAANQMLQTPETSAFKIMAFSLMLPAGGLLSIPIIGLVVDNTSLCTSWSVLFIAFLLYEIFFACASLWDPWMSIISFTFFCFSRPMMYTMGAVHVGRTFGFRTFGRLYGLLFTISGLFSLVQYYMDYAVQHLFAGNYATINSLLILCHLSTLSLPLYLYWTTSKQRNRLTVSSVESRVY